MSAPKVTETMVRVCRKRSQSLFDWHSFYLVESRGGAPVIDQQIFVTSYGPARASLRLWD